MATVTLVVHGRPAPQGSKRHVGGGVLIEQSTHVRPWRDAVRAAALDQDVRGLDGPLAAHVTLTLPKPASAPKTRRTWPLGRNAGDVDKHLRSIFDALVDAGLIVDDSRIVAATVVKTYPGDELDALPQPGAVITITQVQP